MKLKTKSLITGVVMTCFIILCNKNYKCIKLEDNTYLVLKTSVCENYV